MEHMFKNKNQTSPYQACTYHIWYCLVKLPSHTQSPQQPTHCYNQQYNEVIHPTNTHKKTRICLKTLEKKYFPEGAVVRPKNRKQQNITITLSWKTRKSKEYVATNINQQFSLRRDCRLPPPKVPNSVQPAGKAWIQAKSLVFSWICQKEALKKKKLPKGTFSKVQK